MPNNGINLRARFLFRGRIEAGMVLNAKNEAIMQMQMPQIKYNKELFEPIKGNFLK